MISDLCKNIKLSVPSCFYLQYNGHFLYKTNKRSHINNIIIPKDTELQNILLQNLARFIRCGLATLSDKYLLTKANNFILKQDKIVRQFQQGGYSVRKSIVSTRKRWRRDDRVVKRRKFEEHENYHMEMLELVNVEYLITYVTDHTDETTYHREKGFLRRVLKLDVSSRVQAIGEEHCIKSLYETRVDKIVVKTTPVPEADVDLLHERMRGVALNYHYLNIESNSSDTNECVYQFLLKYYKPHLKSLTKQKLMDYFEETDSTIGVSSFQILSFCKRYNIPMYSLDIDMKVFYHHTPEKSSHKYPVLVYVVCNAHMYPVIDDTIRQSIFATERESSSSVAKVFKKSSKSSFNIQNTVVLDPGFGEIQMLKDSNVIFTYMDDLMPLVLYLYQTEKTIYATQSYNGHIKKIQYKNNVNIYVNEDYKETVKVCESLSIPFKNQSNVQLVNEAFQIYSKGDKIHSTFNSVAREVFFNYIKSPFNFTNYYPKEDASLLSFDISKCYTSSTTVNNTSEWSVYSVFDEVEPYKERQSLKTGFYYLKSDNFFPLKGNGWYSKATVDYCKEIGVVFKIMYQFIPTYTLPINYFQEFVDRIYKNCIRLEDVKQDRLSKFLVNSLIGCFNKKSKKSQKDTFTCDMNDAIRHYFSSKESVYFNHEVLGCEDLYQISVPSTTELHENLIPLYWQIIDNANIQVHKLAMKMGGKLVRVSTDCVTVEDGLKVECGTSIGQYRVESPIKPFGNLTETFQNKYEFKLTVSVWHKDFNSKEMLLTGWGGSGKSTMMMKNIESMGDKVAITATTNKAARNIRGQTIHSLLGMRDDGSLDRQQVLKVAQNLEYIVIDEIGMMNRQLFEILYYMKVNSKVKFLLVGDSDQLLPIEDKRYNKQVYKKKQIQYLDSLVVKELVGFNKIRLEENKRSDNVMWDLFGRVEELTPKDFGNEFTIKHLCKTNKKRKEINQKLMDSEVKRRKKKPLVIKKNEYDKESQEVKLLIKFPVMCIRTNKKLGLYNSDTFVVSKLSPLTLRNSLTDKQYEISEEVFKDYFYVNFASTVHRLQGDTIREPYNINEWRKMSKRMKYTAISRTSKKDFINVLDEEVIYSDPESDEDETDHSKMNRNKYMRERLEDPLERKRHDALGVLSKIVKGCNDEYSLEHTGLSRVALLKYLKIENGIPKNYEIDHIKPRKEFKSEAEFKIINHYKNLRLLPKHDNIMRNFSK